MKPDTHMLIYRLGTPVRYKWVATFLTGSESSLSSHKRDMERMGYHVLMPKMVRDTPNDFPRPVHGMPESFSPDYDASNVLDSAWSGAWLADADSYFKWEGKTA